MPNRAKNVACTAIENHTYKIFPKDLNTSNFVFGGLVMSILDRISLVVAERHSGRNCVTASVDAMHFLAPAHLGEILLFKAAINRVWRTSLEIGTRVEAENIKNQTKIHVVSAYFTFVALDENQKPTLLPELILETEAERRRYHEAGIRREARIRIAKERGKK